jgi:hypothetical protein
MLLGVLTKDIEFDYRPDDPYAGTIFGILYKGETMELSNPRIAYFDTTYYEGAITEGHHKGVVLNISEGEVEIINTEWKRLK